MPSALKILIIARCPPYPLHWGDRLTIYHITRELARSGHIIDYIGMSQLEDDVAYLGDYEHLYRHITLLPEMPRSPLSYAQRLVMPASRFPQSAQTSWSPAMWQTIETHLNQHDYDIIHLFGGVHVYEFYHLVAQYKPIIMPYESYSLLLERTIARQGWTLAGIANRLRRWIVRRYEAFMFTPYPVSIVLAEPDRQALLALQPDLDVRVISNGIDLAHWQMLDVMRAPATLLFLGNYTYAPNVDAVNTLIHHILPQVRAQVPDVRLQIVGNAPPQELQALANDHIDIIGRVPDVRPYLAHATAFVSPLQIGAGVKTKILEALAMGVPLIATPISVDGIAVEHGQHALISDVDTMAGQIIRLLSDRSLQMYLSRQARTLIEDHYSTEYIARQHLAIYHDILAG